MSKRIEPWEEELVATVTEHEFTYDASAWSAMEGVLDQANIATDPQKDFSVGNAAPADVVPNMFSAGSLGVIKLLLVGIGLPVLVLLFSIAFTAEVEENATVTASLQTEKNVVTDAVNSENNEEAIDLASREDSSPLITSRIPTNQARISRDPIIPNKPGANSADERMIMRPPIQLISPLPTLPLERLPLPHAEHSIQGLEINSYSSPTTRPTLFPDVEDNY